MLGCCLPAAARAQAQQLRARYDAVSQRLLAAFNTGDPLNLYALTAPAYQARMSAAAFAAGTRKFYVQTGAWETVQFREAQAEGLTYTARFERETEILFLQLDEQDRIVRFHFKPEPVVRTTKAGRVPTDNPLATGTDSLVERLVRPYIQQGHTAGLALAVIERGTVRCYSYGEVQRGSGRLPDPRTTIFEIGSVTKTFTALLLARQVLRGQMRLPDPVNRYLPDSLPTLAYQGSPITLLTLANHTSGLPRLPANIYQGSVDPADPYRHYGPDSLYRFLMRYRPAERPGSQFAYSNLGAGLLGHLLARQAHRSFAQLVRRRLCRPLDLPDTWLELPDAARPRLAQGYDEKGAPTAAWHLAALQGSGAVKSTLRDMVRYTRAQLGQVRTPLARAIELSHQETFRSPDHAMALGWRMARQPARTYWHHSGGTGGARSFVGFDVQHQRGVVVLANAAEDVTAIGQALLER
ncbi:hypothetical protein DLM85_09575 [Hymenobacter edaphi]|uniref:Beta-lactamase-related domain-containing protein n=1 Tax=Hymenobacter edaphi TaxID=2211146 RepID=A0A328BTB0_9BACT|nr:hypothetical protein DLM85_09575 [Hymenobacter edaphi]